MADPEAKAMADAGNDIGCANRISEISAPQVSQFTYVYDRGVIAAFPDPAIGHSFLNGLAVVAEQNPVIGRVLKWLSPSEGGIDVGNAVVRSQLDYLATLGVPGINADVVGTLKGLAETPVVIPVDQVSRVWLQYRPNGRIEVSS
jgi:hypothetical protein